MKQSGSFEIAKKYLDKQVKLVIDRPLGSKHSKHGFTYEVNYGFVPNTTAPDGEELDAYYLGEDKPVKQAEGKCVAIIHRLKNDDDKLVVASSKAENITDEEISKAIHFQEQWFEHTMLRK